MKLLNIFQFRKNINTFQNLAICDNMILITGGAGYIGSHVNKLLNKSGYETIVLDNLSKGHKSAVKWGELVNADLSDSEKVREIFQNNDIEAVMHFAAFSSAFVMVTVAVLGFMLELQMSYVFLSLDS